MFAAKGNLRSFPSQRKEKLCPRQKGSKRHAHHGKGFPFVAKKNSWKKKTLGKGFQKGSKKTLGKVFVTLNLPPHPPSPFILGFTIATGNQNGHIYSSILGHEETSGTKSSPSKLLQPNHVSMTGHSPHISRVCPGLADMTRHLSCPARQVKKSSFCRSKKVEIG